MFLALAIATVIYVAIALAVFGTLSVEKVISSGGTAIAVAAEPVLGRAGYWLMTDRGAVCLGLVLGFKLDSIASIGCAVALMIFTLITAAHLRIRAETGASLRPAPGRKHIQTGKARRVQLAR
jgi:hypothetical protein